MGLSHFVTLEQGSTLNLIQWLQNKSLLANLLRCAQCNMALDLRDKNVNHIDGFHWYVISTLPSILFKNVNLKL